MAEVDKAKQFACHVSSGPGRNLYTNICKCICYFAKLFNYLPSEKCDKKLVLIANFEIVIA